MLREPHLTRSLAIGFVLLLPLAAHAQNCAQAATGRIPLIDLGAGLYLGQFQGGLYPGGSNNLPVGHLGAGLAAAAQMVPRDTSGTPDPQNGKIVLISVGMSSTSAEFCVQGSGTTGCWPQSFMGLAAASPAVNHTTLAIVNGARAGQDASDWLDPAGANYAALATLLASQGLSEFQVQAAWVKLADTNPPATLPSATADARVLEGRLGTIVRTLKVLYPNLRQVFFSSRIYGGYAVVLSSPEPSAYEGGFAVKWLVESQIAQMATPLNPIDPIAGDLDDTTVAPWIGWAAYLWADGVTPRSDGLTWPCSEFQRDGVHLLTSAVPNVAGRLLDFFLHSPVTQAWFPAVAETQAPTVTILAPADGTNAQPGAPLTFAGIATDFRGGDLTANLQWTSSIDGPLGNGGAISAPSLSLGTHWITATATDGSGLTSSQAIYVGVPPLKTAFRAIGAEDGFVVEYPPYSNVGQNVFSTYDGMNVGDQSNHAQVKLILSFDTSSLPDDATVLTARLRLYRTAFAGHPFGNLGRLLVDAQTGAFGGDATLQASDFQAVATAPAVASMIDPMLTGDGWSSATLDAEGLLAINTTGRTQLRLAFELHDDGNLTNDRITFASGDNADPRLWPELDVTYLSASSASTTTMTTPATTSTTAATVTTTTTTSTSSSSSSTTTSVTLASTTTTLAAPVTVAFRSIGAEDGAVGETTSGSGMGGAVNSTNSNMQLGDQSTGAQSKVFASFDTSTIPPTATILAATLRLNRVGLTGTNPFDSLGRLLVDVQTGSFGGDAALRASDFQAASAAPAAASLSNPTTSGAWSSGTLSAAGLAAINKTGRTQVRLAFEVHDNGNGVTDRIWFATGDHANPGLWPELDVTYVP